MTLAWPLIGRYAFDFSSATAEQNPTKLYQETTEYWTFFWFWYWSRTRTFDKILLETPNTSNCCRITFTAQVSYALLWAMPNFILSYFKIQKQLTNWCSLSLLFHQPYLVCPRQTSTSRRRLYFCRSQPGAFQNVIIEKLALSRFNRTVQLKYCCTW